MKIGYIYTYNETLNKGIICHGHGISRYNSNDVDIFTKDCCETIVKTGDLVYFKKENGTICNIVKASLQNFKRNYFYALAHNFDSGVDNWKRTIEKTHISFSSEEDADWVIRNIKKDPDDPQYILASMRLNMSHAQDIIEFTYNAINNSSLSLFRGAYKSIDILNINNWDVETSVAQGNYYGRTLSEVVDLLEIFEIKERNAKKQHYLSIQHKDSQFDEYNNKRISGIWSLLFEKLSESELWSILKKYPITQPCMPKDFCLRNIDKLTDEYDFIDDDTCFAYYDHMINKCISIRDYSDIQYDLDQAMNFDNSKVQTCKDFRHILALDKDLVSKLKQILEVRFENEVLPRFYVDLKSKINNTECISLESFVKDKDAINIGLFIDRIDDINHRQDKLDLFTFSLLAEEYFELNANNKVYLYPLLRETIEHNLCKIDFLKDYSWYSFNKLFGSLKKIFDEKDFAKLLDNTISLLLPNRNAEEISELFDGGYIEESLFDSKFKEVTNSYSAQQLVLLVEKKRLPLCEQKLVLELIIDKLDYRGLESGLIIGVPHKNYLISNNKDLITWINDNSNDFFSKEDLHINPIVRETIISQIVRTLSDSDIWFLIKDGTLKNPGEFFIKAHYMEFLNNVSDVKIRKVEKKDIFQNVLVDEILCNKLSFDNYKVQELLSSSSKKAIIERADENLKLKLWLKNMDEDIDLDLVSKYYSSLDYSDQIKIFKFLFYLIASGSKKLSLDEIYDITSCSGDDRNIIVDTILCIVRDKGIKLEKDKICSLFSISSPSCNNKDHIKKRISEFFYSCTGRMAVATNLSRSFIERNGKVSKEQKNGKEYYVIEFYSTPIDENGNEIYPDDYESIGRIRDIFLLNFDIAYTDEFEDEYWIETNAEIELRSFMRLYSLDDCCDLFPDGDSCNPLHENYNRKVSHEEDHAFLCSRCRCNGISPVEKIPFAWCNKKPCTHYHRLFNVYDDWEQYKLIDLLRIVYSEELSKEQILSINAEVTDYLNDSLQDNDSNSFTTSSTNNTSDDYGEWTKDMSVTTYKEEYDDNDDIEDFSIIEQEDEHPLYEKYNGSYAQDEMGYSDDDIDTIFDGDPDAYWNID